MSRDFAIEKENKCIAKNDLAVVLQWFKLGGGSTLPLSIEISCILLICSAIFLFLFSLPLSLKKIMKNLLIQINRKRLTSVKFSAFEQSRVGGDKQL